MTYLENNRAGITVFGFMLDGTLLHMVFMVELRARISSEEDESISEDCDGSGKTGLNGI